MLQAGHRVTRERAASGSMSARHLAPWSASTVRTVCRKVWILDEPEQLQGCMGYQIKDLVDVVTRMSLIFG